MMWKRWRPDERQSKNGWYKNKVCQFVVIRCKRETTTSVLHAKGSSES